MGHLHELTFILLYAALAAVIYFAVERGLFYWTCTKDFVALRQTGPGAAQAMARPGSVPSVLLSAAAQGLTSAPNAARAGDLTEKIFIDAQRRMNRHLWIFDTVITAAPLMGLLGTILGIFDTFSALARSGISDAQAVSAGIGVALLATALGIAVALIGLLLYNVLQDHAERLLDDVKLLLLDLQPQH